MTFVSPHTSYALTTGLCVSCHRTHSGQGPSILSRPTQSKQCLGCHDADGTGSSLTTESEWFGIPANDPSSGAWYSHQIASPSAHTSDTADEFGGISNRHSACADCHDAHAATNAAPKEGSDGWSASGAIAGASSVKVTNHAGSAPAYALVQGPVTIDSDGTLQGGIAASFEYELCFKCHSGFTDLPSHASGPSASHPSWWALDKGRELDPLNAVSFHPVESAGMNQTDAMAASLAGTSPYKLWNFKSTETIRCTNCHAGPDTPADGTRPDALLPSHASNERGILLAPYRDRDLKPANEAYAAADFALCFLCHAEAPMADASSTTATNFSGTPGAPYASSLQSLHALHLAGTATDSTGTSGDIDKAGAGQGNAVCAECHFRLHSTALAFKGDDRGNSRLVNFAPNVATVEGTPSWVSTGVGQGGCTLTCHGYAHNAVKYGP